MRTDKMRAHFDLVNFAIMCKKSRHAREESQSQVAKNIGISQPMYSNFESGGRTPSRSSLSKICAYYELDPQSFFSDKEKKDYSALGQEILKAQMKQGLTDVEMREHLGISGLVYNRILHSGSASVETIAQICEILGVPFDRTFLAGETAEEDRA